MQIKHAAMIQKKSFNESLQVEAFHLHTKSRGLAPMIGKKTIQSYDRLYAIRFFYD